MVLTSPEFDANVLAMEHQGGPSAINLPMPAFQKRSPQVADSSAGLANRGHLRLGSVDAEGERPTTKTTVALCLSVGDDFFEGGDELDELDDITQNWPPRDDGRQLSPETTSSTTISRADTRNDHQELLMHEIPRQLLEQPVTALMVHYIPSRQSQRSLMLEWPHRSVSSDGYNYNLLYIPYNVRQRRISGYAFLNFETHSDALHFASHVHGGTVGRTSGKQLMVSHAARQGISANVIHWQSTLQQVTNPAYLPVVFRKGGRLDFWAYAEHLQTGRDQEIAATERTVADLTVRLERQPQFHIMGRMQL